MKDDNPPRIHIIPKNETAPPQKKRVIEFILAAIGTVLSLILSLVPVRAIPTANLPPLNPTPPRVSLVIAAESPLDSAKSRLSAFLDEALKAKALENTNQVCTADESGITLDQFIKGMRIELYFIEQDTQHFSDEVSSTTLATLLGDIQALLDESQSQLELDSIINMRQHMEELVGAIQEVLEKIDDEDEDSGPKDTPVSSGSGLPG